MPEAVNFIFVVGQSVRVYRTRADGSVLERRRYDEQADAYLVAFPDGSRAWHFGRELEVSPGPGPEPVPEGALLNNPPL